MILTIILTIVHVLVCLFLMVVVLLQSGKAADLAGAFGGMGSQTVFGPRGAATALSRATTISAVLFMVTSLSLSILATREGKQAGGPGAGAKSVLETTKDPSAGKPGATPGAQPKVELFNEEGQKVGEQPIDIPPPPGQAPQQQQQQQQKK
jgi:preprotein translocase subunit SecG